MRKSSRSGQAMVEFALVSMVLLVIVLGIMDFSYLFAGRTEAFQATRVAARFAATHPTAWNTSTPADRTSIEGNLVLTAVPAQVATVTITYWIPGASGGTQCGHVAAGAFVGEPKTPGTYLQTDCVKPGSVIQVAAAYTYTFITPMLRLSKGSVTLSTIATALEEV